MDLDLPAGPHTRAEDPLRAPSFLIRKMGASVAPAAAGGRGPGEQRPAPKAAGTTNGGRAACQEALTAESRRVRGARPPAQAWRAWDGVEDEENIRRGRTRREDLTR